VSDGDVLLGLGSDGVHSNGFSLVRKVVDHAGLTWDAPAPFAESTVGEALLAPTRLYVTQVLEAIQAGGVHALAHITGGGLTENLPRVLPEGLGADIDLSAWELPAVFKWLAEAGGTGEADMLKTFNCGIGMILAVDPARAEALTAVLAAAGETVTTLGTVTQGEGVRYTGSLI
jgi:phosphoribosylformylglycinamidine cyclo-ligase